MELSAEVAVILGIALTAGLVGLPHVAERLFGVRCLNCGRRSPEQVDFEVLYDNASEWSLHCCSRCGEEFVRSLRGFTSRSEWTGDPGAEQMFQDLESRPK